VHKGMTSTPSRRAQKRGGSGRRGLSAAAKGSWRRKKENAFYRGNFNGRQRDPDFLKRWRESMRGGGRKSQGEEKLEGPKDKKKK